MTDDPRIERGMRAQLERRAALLAEGAQPLGWKVGFNVPATQERLGIDGPLAGFLTSAGLLDDGDSYSLAGAPAIVPYADLRPRQPAAARRRSTPPMSSQVA